LATSSASHHKAVVLIKLLDIHEIFLIKAFRVSRPEVRGVPTAKRLYQTLETDCHRNNFDIITKLNGKVPNTRVIHGKLNPLT